MLGGTVDVLCYRDYTREGKRINTHSLLIQGVQLPAKTEGEPSVFNPRRMRRRVMVVVLCVCMSVCLSVTTLAATYLVCESNFRCYKVPYDILNA